MNGQECPACGVGLRSACPWVRSCAACSFMMSTLQAGTGSEVEGLEAVRALNYETILDLIERLLPCPDPRLLEVGCAKGWFVACAAGRGMQIEGIEPALDAGIDVDVQTLNIRSGYFPEALSEDARYDAIVFNDVFEHLPDPVSAIVEIERRLDPGGLAVLNLPSSDGVIFRFAYRLYRLGVVGPYHRLWQKGLDSPHITYFNPRNLRSLVERHTGLRHVYTGRMAVLTRSGLWDRISSTYSRGTSLVVYLISWLGSFVLDFFPSDAVLAVFRKDRDSSPASTSPRPLSSESSGWAQRQFDSDGV